MQHDKKMAREMLEAAHDMSKCGISFVVVPVFTLDEMAEAARCARKNAEKAGLHDGSYFTKVK